MDTFALTASRRNGLYVLHYSRSLSLWPMVRQWRGRVYCSQGFTSRACTGGMSDTADRIGRVDFICIGVFTSILACGSVAVAETSIQFPVGFGAVRLGHSAGDAFVGSEFPAGVGSSRETGRGSGKALRRSLCGKHSGLDC